MAAVGSANESSSTPFAQFFNRLNGLVPELASSVGCKLFCDVAKSHEEQFRIVDDFMNQSTSAAGIVKISERQDRNGKSEAEAVAARNRGNKLFAERKWQKALEEYNTSLRLAPVSAPQRGMAALCLPLAYANRSAVLFNQGRHLECILDIDQAAKYGYPEEKIMKLTIRKAKSYLAMEHFAKTVECLEKCVAESNGEPRMQQFGPNEKEEAEKILLVARENLKKQQAIGARPLDMHFRHPNGPVMLQKAERFCLAGGHNKDLTCASALLKIPRSSGDEDGKYFVAARDINAGEVLLKDSAFVSAPRDRYMESNCMACLVATDNPTFCETCANVAFCSMDCASGAKAQIHAKECPLLWTLRPGAEKWDPPHRAEGLQTLLIAVYRVFLMKPCEEWNLLADAKREGHGKEFDQILESSFPHRYSDIYRLPESNPLSIEEQVVCGFGAWFAVTILEHTEGFESMDAELRNFFGGVALQHLKSFSWDMLTNSEFVIYVPAGTNRFDNKVVGYSLYPALRSFGNACYPNAIRAFFGDTLVFRATRPIKKNEIVTMIKATDVKFMFNPMREERGFKNMLSSCTSYTCGCQMCKFSPSYEDQSKEPWKVICGRCRDTFEVGSSEVGSGGGYCRNCGPRALPCCVMQLVDYVRGGGFDRCVRSEDDLAYLFELSGELSKCLVEPPLPQKALLYHEIPTMWSYQGNKKLMFDF